MIQILKIAFSVSDILRKMYFFCIHTANCCEFLWRGSDDRHRCLEGLARSPFVQHDRSSTGILPLSWTARVWWQILGWKCASAWGPLQTKKNQQKIKDIKSERKCFMFLYNHEQIIRWWRIHILKICFNDCHTAKSTSCRLQPNLLAFHHLPRIHPMNHCLAPIWNSKTNNLR